MYNNIPTLTPSNPSHILVLILEPCTWSPSSTCVASHPPSASPSLPASSPRSLPSPTLLLMASSILHLLRLFPTIPQHMPLTGGRAPRFQYGQQDWSFSTSRALCVWSCCIYGSVSIMGQIWSGSSVIVMWHGREEEICCQKGHSNRLLFEDR